MATIGNFDGVHLGHQAVLRQVARHAMQMQLPAVVMTFEPQPLEYFSPRAAPPRLTTFREKFVLLKQQAVNCLICLRFGAPLAQLSAGEFVEQLLVRRLGIRLVVVGDDFRFGRNREGDYRRLKELAGRNGFEVAHTETCVLGGSRVSSSHIRQALENGELEAAAVMLGRRFRISGRVVCGDRRGRKLGFPTANVDLSRRNAPLRGIFAVRIHGLNGAVHEGVASVGTRPAFDGGSLLLEAHLFRFDGAIYGRRIEVEFLCRLRAEQNFDSVEQLRNQIEKDVEQAQAYFRSGASAPVAAEQELRKNT